LVKLGFSNFIISIVKFLINLSLLKLLCLAIFSIEFSKYFLVLIFCIVYSFIQVNNIRIDYIRFLTNLKEYG